MSEPKEHWALKAEELKKNRKFEEAIKILDKVKEIEKEETQDDFWYQKAINYCDIGEYEKAKDSLDKELETNQKSYKTFFLLGKILYDLKKYEESLEWFNKASEEHGSQHLRYAQKIEKMKNARKFEEAVKYSDLVHQEKPLDEEYWSNRGHVLFKLKKFNEASSCFEKVLETNPKDVNSLYELGKSELLAGNKEKSFENLEKACKIDAAIVEKMRIDLDFDKISQEKQFRILVGL